MNLNENNIGLHDLTDNNSLYVKPCMLPFFQTLPHILCAGTISRVSFLNLFGSLAGVSNPII